jgi:hypothetical protein
MKLRVYILTLFALFLIKGKAQDGVKALQEVLDIEKHNCLNNDKEKFKKNMYLSYDVKVTEWDNKMSVSHIKVHRQGYKMHFFSEQVTMYLDEKESAIILPVQKLLVLNSSNEQVAASRITEDQYKFREEFLRSCSVVTCTTLGDGTKSLVLKVDENKADASILIRTMIYRYDPETKQFKSIRTIYDDDYDVKELTITFNELREFKGYEFGSVRSHIMTRKGTILSRFSNYEIVDNRDQGLAVQKK